MPIFTALPTEIVNAYRAGGGDAFGNPPERHISKGAGNQCRHCLRHIPDGAEMLVMAHKPFAEEHPYSEVGPLFICADDCERGGGTDLPETLSSSPDYLIKGYSSDDRIVYGTGIVTPTPDMLGSIASIFDNPDVSYIHVRSARNNCYQARVDRDG